MKRVRIDFQKNWLDYERTGPTIFDYSYSTVKNVVIFEKLYTLQKMVEEQGHKFKFDIKFDPYDNCYGKIIIKHNCKDISRAQFVILIGELFGEYLKLR